VAHLCNALAFKFDSHRATMRALFEPLGGVMHMKRLAVSAVCIWFVSGCRMLPDKPPMVTIPAAGVSTLTTTGIPMPEVTTTALSLIRPTDAGSIVFQHEWRDAPSMTMVSMGRGLTSSIDAPLRGLISSLSPLETEFAVCDSQVVAGVQQQIPPNADGKWDPVVLDGGSFLLNRIKGELGSISITPGSGDGTPALVPTFDLSVTVSKLSLGLGLRYQGAPYDAPDGYHVDVASAAISCTARITHEVIFNFQTMAPSPCGEQRIACVPGTVVLNVTRPTSNLPPTLNDVLNMGWNLVGERAIRETLESGVVLHFEHFAASALGFTSGGTLLLQGTSTMTDAGTSVCSPNALVPPQIPPTRGLVQVHSYNGVGETRSVDGYVRGFTVRPNLTTTFTGALPDAGTITKTLVAGARLYPGDQVQMFGSEFASIDQFDVKNLTTGLSADRIDSACWTKQTVVNDIIKFVPNPVFGRFEGTFLKSETIAKAVGTREFRVSSVSQADPREVQLAMKGLGLGCGACTGYWRVDGVLGPKNYPTTWPPPSTDPFDFDVPPYMGQLWFHDDPTRTINDRLPCLIGIHPVKDEVVIALPQVRLFDSLFDSARVNSMGYAPKGNTATASEATFTYQNNTHRTVVLQKDCWNRRVSPCWESQLPSPDKYTLAALGRSGTTIARLDPRDAIRAGSVATYGVGGGVPWGFFDRSQIDLYSSVPAEYAQAGVTTTAWDWRGRVRADWQHDSAFPAPGSAQSLLTHDWASGSDWWGVAYFDPAEGLVPYRANFSSDRVMLRRRVGSERSFCTSEDTLSVMLEEIRFRNMTRGGEARVPASEMFPIPAGTSAQVSGGNYMLGSMNAFFLH